MGKTENIEKVKGIIKKLEKSNGFILTDFKGLNVSEISDLRRRIKEEKYEYKVLKNTLLGFAFKEMNISELNEHLSGPTAIAFTEDNTTGLSKLLVDFSKEFKSLKIKCGYFEGEFINDENIIKIASLPSYETLISMLMSTLKAPLYGIVSVLNGPNRALVSTLNQIAKSKEN
ncbi:MAG: 50S ribosomal protein L10 [Actinomycetia bacterium]|nr:50S ribosomal protein L10 [Actinomycetes bacterium]